MPGVGETPLKKERLLGKERDLPGEEETLPSLWGGRDLKSGGFGEWGIWGVGGLGSKGQYSQR